MGVVDDRLVDKLLFRAQAEGLQLTGPGGLQPLTKRLLESAPDSAITDRLGRPVTRSVATLKMRSGCWPCLRFHRALRAKWKACWPSDV